ncbi:endonuclease V [Candidatus Woesearchaeota archaeon]|nr:MAG: endonuclease V [Candidatus Woesearchaeota archaeon]
MKIAKNEIFKYWQTSRNSENRCFMRFDYGKLKEMQSQIARSIREEGIKPEEIRYVAGFEAVFYGSVAIIGAAVFNFKTGELVEKKTLSTKAPMNYVPGFEAFREGPLICQLYYDLEYEPDVLIVSGAGKSHARECGTAAFVGVELSKPVIGVAKGAQGEITESGKVLVEGEVRAARLQTKEHAKPVFVSVGNNIALKDAVFVVGKLIVPPHKMPEPLHVARRLAKTVAKERTVPARRERALCKA